MSILTICWDIVRGVSSLSRQVSTVMTLTTGGKLQSQCSLQAPPPLPPTQLLNRYLLKNLNTTKYFKNIYYITRWKTPPTNKQYWNLPRPHLAPVCPAAGQCGPRKRVNLLLKFSLPRNQVDTNLQPPSLPQLNIWASSKQQSCTAALWPRIALYCCSTKL